jgi:hypothetical protein
MMDVASTARIDVLPDGERFFRDGFRNCVDEKVNA